jgi:hypothetical protein
MPKEQSNILVAFTRTGILIAFADKAASIPNYLRNY